MHEDHPNLSPEINRNIRESELAGGIWWKDMPVGTVVEVQTKNTLYRIEKRADGDYIKGHEHFCPEFTKCHISGSTWGGSMLKVGFIGIDMHLEFWCKEKGTVTTSPIHDARVVSAMAEGKVA